MHHFVNVKKRNGVSFAHSTTEKCQNFYKKGVYAISFQVNYIHATKVLISTVNSSLRVCSLIKEFRHLKDVL